MNILNNLAVTLLLADLLVAALLLLFAGIACARGFVKVFLGFTGLVIAFVLASLLCGPLADFCESAFGWSGKLTESYAGGVFSGSQYAEVVTDRNLTAALSHAGVPKLFANSVLRAVEDLGTSPVGGTVGTVLAIVCAYATVKCIAFVVLFLVFGIALRLLAGLLTRIANRIVLIGWVNRLLGLLLGLLEGFFFLYLVLFLCFLFFGAKFSAFLDETTLVRFFYENNLLALLFDGSLGDWIAGYFGQWIPLRV